MRNILSQKEINHIDEICKKFKIENYSINPDGSIDVDGYVDLSEENLKELPIKFGKVSGCFYCNNNDLTSLEFSPSSVGGYFNFYANDLPYHFMGLYNNLSNDEFNIFLKYQHDLRIWDNNEYNEEEAQILYEEIKDGMR